MVSNEDHFSYAMELVNSIARATVLRTAIKLKVLEAIAESGPNALLSSHDIASRLSISNQEAPEMLDRMLLLLASHSIVTCTEAVHESRHVRVYGLTPVAKCFIPNEDGASLGPFIHFVQDQVFFDSWLGLEDAILKGGVPFDMVHGANAFEYPAMDARFNEVFNKAMVNHTTFVTKEILKQYKGFDNLRQLVDVGGGLGICLNMIVSKHPTVKGINFDLPHVIQHAPLYPGIEHIGGDMFKEVPKADAIFMKWILHNWDDDSCIKLLKNCYKALPEKGKVIIVDAILPFITDTSSTAKAITCLDLAMMAHHGGKERTEDEFLALAKHCGFAGIRKECFVCNSWVMEFYK